MGGACFAGKPRWIRKLYFGLLGSLPTAPLGKGLRIMLAHIGHPAPQTPPPGVSAMGTRAWHGAALALGVACAAACAAVAAAGVRWWAVALLCVYVQAGSRTGHWALPPPPARADSARRAARAPQFRAACGVAACEGASARPKKCWAVCPKHPWDVRGGHARPTL